MSWNLESMALGWFLNELFRSMQAQHAAAQPGAAAPAADKRVALHLHQAPANVTKKA